MVIAFFPKLLYTVVIWKQRNTFFFLHPVDGSCFLVVSKDRRSKGTVNNDVQLTEVIENFGTVFRSVLDGFPIVLLWFFISPLASRIPLATWDFIDFSYCTWIFKITIFNRTIIYKWAMFNIRVYLPDGRLLQCTDL